jgi:hypothetical protein
MDVSVLADRLFQQAQSSNIQSPPASAWFGASQKEVPRSTAFVSPQQALEKHARLAHMAADSPVNARLAASAAGALKSRGVLAVQPAPHGQARQAAAPGEAGLINPLFMCYMNACLAVVLRIPTFAVSLVQSARAAAREHAGGDGAPLTGMEPATVRVLHELCVLVPAFQVGEPASGPAMRLAADTGPLAQVSTAGATLCRARFVPEG